ncbi:BglG family transcription antiterminator [Thermoanaerobacterium sp. DL9XJH110]|uniref:BglG family transcription antiterminator n=1 Tax=Thermoanaerobacterium sp. DL9XJH110 TaxID=3386643 RepID=UPI003BB72B20
MALDARFREILKILINRNGPVTTEDIAQKLKVSSRTVRHDLQKLQEFLDGFDIRIVKKPKTGVYLDGTNEKKAVLLDHILQSDCYYLEPFSPHEREKYIISRLLQSGKNLTTQQLADELFVSKVTVYKDLDNVEKWLSRHGLKLMRKPNYGLEIAGSEENLRKAFSDFLVNNIEKGRLKELVQEPFLHPLDRRLSAANFTQLVRMFPKIDVRKLERIILEAEAMMHLRFIDESYTALIVHLAIMIKRLQDKKDIKVQPLRLANLTGSDEYRIAEFIAGRLENEFGMRIPESEIVYISLHILGAKIEKRLPLKEETVDEMLKDFEKEILEIVYDMISVVENTLEVKLSNDKFLIAGLALHLRPVINRIRYGMNLHNPILDQIKENYTSVYGIAWITAGIIEKRLGIKVGEEEVGYLAMHLGAAIERATAPKKALVICSSGIGTAQMLAARLKKVFPEILVEDVISVPNVDEILKCRKVDFIISTVPLELNDIPAVLVSPLLTEGDIAKIRELIGKSSSIKLKPTRRDFEGGLVYELIPEELIFCKKTFDSKEQIIEEIGRILVDRCYVEPDFVKAAQQREKITSTYIGRGVAIPHGEDRFVIKPTVAVITLKAPVEWWGKQVDLVFYLALRFNTSKYTKAFFKEFYEMLDRPDILDMIREAKAPGEIKKILACKGGNF